MPTDSPQDDAPETAVPAPAASPDRRWIYAIGGAIVLVGAGVAASHERGGPAREVRWSQDRATPQAPAPAPVAESPPSPRPQAVAVQVSDVRGVIKARNEATIASRITARIIAMPYREGESFAKGALLARFDCSQTYAQLRAAHAASMAYRKTYETNVELDEYQAVGKNEVAVSQANLGKAVAETNAVAAQLGDCAMRAPFAGTVVEAIGHPREVAASGQPLLKIQSGDNLEIELIVPSRWLTWLKPGAPFRFRIDETGRDAGGVVTRLGASVDAVSKTIRVTAGITGKSGLVLPGMSGSAYFDQAGRVVATVDGKPAVVDGKPS